MNRTIRQRWGTFLLLAAWFVVDAVKEGFRQRLEDPWQSP